HPPERGIKRCAGKRVEAGFVNDQFARLRLQPGGRLVSAGAGDAHPAPRSLPVWQPPVFIAVDGGPDMDDRDAAAATILKQHRRAGDYGVCWRVEFWCRQVVALQINEQQRGLHASCAISAERRICSATSSAMAFVPRIRQSGSARSAVRQPARQTAPRDFSTSAAASSRPKLSRSSIANERIWPAGLAVSVLARSCAQPWLV